ncbi:hypothetical protein Tcan_06172 [Toxocara canis]|uniref:Uncharacterized protein n=1 Tax=Toxocara canis TaxID=6265 RepID=A0A0B2V8S6_TOXCA|nr:hypothetical protein Tcan_06172 [Toxocara canis]
MQQLFTEHGAAYTVVFDRRTCRYVVCQLCGKNVSPHLRNIFRRRQIHSNLPTSLRRLREAADGSRVGCENRRNDRTLWQVRVKRGTLCRTRQPTDTTLRAAVLI